MTQAGEDLIHSSDDADLARALRRARRSGMFESLARIYSEFPETTCENCARCCFESPGIFFVEYLHLIGELGRMRRARRETLLRRALAELFFCWIAPDRQCIFLESKRCTIYDHRPLACRLFGLISPEDRDRAEAEARLAARREAQRLHLFGIQVPEAIVQRSLASCERVLDRSGRPVRVDGDAIAARIGRLDAALLPQQVVVQEFCFRSLPERLGAVALGAQTIEPMRVQLLRRAQRGEAAADLLDQVWRQVRLPAPLRNRKGGR